MQVSASLFVCMFSFLNWIVAGKHNVTRVVIINSALKLFFCYFRWITSPCFHGHHSAMAPIEHAWDELGRRIASGPPLQTVDLRQALVREWQQIPQAFFRTLVNSTRSRCQSSDASNGGHTRFRDDCIRHPFLWLLVFTPRSSWYFFLNNVWL